jgi:topoisomerase-4 subunit A
VFKKADGLTWIDSAGRTFTLSWAELRDWIGVRAQQAAWRPRASRAPTPSARLFENT